MISNYQIAINLSIHHSKLTSSINDKLWWTEWDMMRELVGDKMHNIKQLIREERDEI